MTRTRIADMITKKGDGVFAEEGSSETAPGFVFMCGAVGFVSGSGIGSRSVDR